MKDKYYHVKCYKCEVSVQVMLCNYIQYYFLCKMCEKIKCTGVLYQRKKVQTLDKGLLALISRVQHNYTVHACMHICLFIFVYVLFNQNPQPHNDTYT